MNKCMKMRWVVWLGLIVTAAGCRDAVSTPSSRQATPEAAKGPLVVLDERRREVGEVDVQPRPYTFTITNGGDQPLQLEVVKKSCSCTEVQLPPAPIAPGQRGDVTLRWAPTPNQSGPVAVSADLATNDPQTPLLQLEVKAQANPLIRIAPESRAFVDFDQLQPGKPSERQVKVFSTRLSHFELQAKTTHPGLAVTTAPLAAESQVEGVRALSGYAVVVKTTDKLPGGYFSENLLLSVQAPGEAARTIEMPVYGENRSGKFTLGPQEVQFQKPKVTEPDTKIVRVHFLAAADDESVDIVKQEPAFLVCDPPHKRQPGDWEFKISLPANNAEAAKLQPDGFFAGRIVLQLKTAGTTQEAQVRVKWKPADH
jgi:hypothetical protein